VGEGWSWSAALWDPKAFTWLGARGVLAIPFQDYAAGAFVSDLRLFHVDPLSGIAPLGSLSMAEVYASWTAWDFFWAPWVRRGILADDFVYAVSDAGVRSAKVAELPAWLATVRFARPASP
jgi:beta propeller domain-containing protein